MPAHRLASRPLILALDIGTSSTRALLYDARGRAQPGRAVQIEYQQTFVPDGGVEFDADRLVEWTVNAIRELLGRCDGDEIARIAAVGGSCFWHGLLGIDAHGYAVTPIYSWADTRSRGVVERLADLLGAAAYHERTGAFLHSSYWPAKIAWLRSTQPHIADRVRRWLSFADYLMLRLCGRACTSLSTASGTGLLDVRAGHWDETTLKALAIDPSTMPQIAAPGETLTITDRRLSARLGKVPCYPPLGDGACSNIGAGGVDATRLVVNVSTSGAIRVLSPKTERAIPRGLFQYRMDERRFVIGGAVSNGGNVYAWLARTLQFRDPARLDGMLQRALPDGHGLTVLPFWAGERSPGWHANATGSIVGLNLGSTPLDIAQASLEAVAYTIRSLRGDLLNAFPMATQLIISGGAVERSKYMPRLLASALDAPVRMSLDPEPSGRGAALAVSEALGLLEGIEKSPSLLSKPISPEPAAADAYARAYARYEVLYHELIGRPLDQTTAKTEERLQHS